MWKPHYLHSTPKFSTFTHILSLFFWLPFPTFYYCSAEISHAFLAFSILATCPASRSLLGFNILPELDDYINHVGPCYVMLETAHYLCVCVCVCVL